MPSPMRGGTKRKMAAATLDEDDGAEDDAVAAKLATVRSALDGVRAAASNSATKADTTSPARVAAPAVREAPKRRQIVDSDSDDE